MFALEDSGLILSAEGPLGVLFGVHDPGDTGMRLGILVHFRGLQLENKERKGMLGHPCFWDRASGDSKHGETAALPNAHPKNVHVCREAALAGEAFESFTARTCLATSVSTQHPEMTSCVRPASPYYH